MLVDFLVLHLSMLQNKLQTWHIYDQKNSVGFCWTWTVQHWLSTYYDPLKLFNGSVKSHLSEYTAYMCVCYKTHIYNPNPNPPTLKLVVFVYWITLFYKVFLIFHSLPLVCQRKWHPTVLIKIYKEATGCFFLLEVSVNNIWNLIK